MSTYQIAYLAYLSGLYGGLTAYTVAAVIMVLGWLGLGLAGRNMPAKSRVWLERFYLAYVLSIIFIFTILVSQL